MKLTGNLNGQKQAGWVWKNTSLKIHSTLDSNNQPWKISLLPRPQHLFVIYEWWHLRQTLQGRNISNNPLRKECGISHKIQVIHLILPQYQRWSPARRTNQDLPSTDHPIHHQASWYPIEQYNKADAVDHYKNPPTWLWLSSTWQALLLTWDNQAT